MTETPQRRSAWRFWAALGAALLCVALIAGEPPAARVPLDPASTDPSGARAFVLLLQSYGITVQASADIPSSTGPTVVLLADQLDSTRRSALASWVERGGTLVLADPGSRLMPSVPATDRPFGNEDQHLDGPCRIPSLPALAEVRRIDIGTSFVLDVPDGAEGCFAPPAKQAAATAAGRAFVIVVGAGRGRIIALGGAGVFSNGYLDQDDNSALAVALGRSSTASAMTILLPSPVASGTKGASTLVPRPVKLGLVELLVAFAFVAWWRARRLGKPVVEYQPVQVAASELVVASANLLARSRHLDAAAQALRARTADTLASAAGVGRRRDLDELVDALGARTGLSRDRLRDALGPRPPQDEAALVALAQQLEQIRQEVMHAQS